MPTKPGEVVLGGNFRVTVSADGSKAERVDAMARMLLPASKPPKGLEGQKPLAVNMSQIVSSRPLDVRKYAAEQGLAETEVLESGMQEKRKEFLENGAEVYTKV